MADVTQQDIYNVLAAIKDARHDNIMATNKTESDLTRQIDAIDDSHIWVPRNSINSQPIVCLGGGSGVVVTVVKA